MDGRMDGCVVVLLWGMATATVATAAVKVDKEFTSWGTIGK